MKKIILKIALSVLIVTTLFSCGNKNVKNNTFEDTVITDSENNNYEESDGAHQIPQITTINRSPDRLSKEVETYTVTLTTEGKKVKLEDTEFSLNGKDWQKSAEFKNVRCGENTFYARNKQNKSLQDQKEMYLECFVDVQLPTIPQLTSISYRLQTAMIMQAMSYENLARICLYAELPMSAI